MFILSFVLIGMHSIYIWQLVWPVAAPLIMHMCGYIRGVATVWIYPYPAVIFSQVSVIMSMGGMVSLPPYSFQGRVGCLWFHVHSWGVGY